MNKGTPPQSGIQGFQCDICGSIFSFSYALEEHRRTYYYTDIEQKSQACSYSSSKTSDLKKYLLTDSVISHQCTYCDKALMGNADLQRHILTHTRERPFACKTCGKDFNRLEILQIHERKHTQEKPYKCSQCDYESSNNSNLRRHVVVHHTKDFQHWCPFCREGFYSPFYLKKHMNSEHSTNVESNQ